MRLFWIFIGLAALVLVPFVLWGEGFEAAFTQAGAMRRLRQHGDLAWAAGIVLLALDLVLPIPATAVMAALGLLYGPLLGGLIGTAGSCLAGAIGYGLCRRFGRGAALRLLGVAELAQGERLFAQAGGWLVVLSRWLPVFPEVIACMAGLTRMPAGTFLTALVLGTAPLAFVFAAVGHAGAARPLLALGLSALLPPVLWLLVQPWFRARQRAPAPPER